MKFIKWLFQWILVIGFGALVIIIAAMFFMFVAGNVGGVGGRTMQELHSDLVEVEKYLEGHSHFVEHRHIGMFGGVRRNDK